MQMTKPDSLAWMQVSSHSQLQDRLAWENDHTSKYLHPLRSLQEQLADEILERTQWEKPSCPVQQGPYRYYTRYIQSQPYPIHCRCPISAPRKEQVLLDENQFAFVHSHFEINSLSLSPDQSFLAYAMDTTGDERFNLHFKDLTQNCLLPERLYGVAPNIAWANNLILFYVRLDSNSRPYQLCRHHLGDSPEKDVVIFTEYNEQFAIRVRRSESGQLLFLTNESLTTTEVYYLPTAFPKSAWTCFLPKQQGQRYWLTHQGDSLFSIIQDESPQGRLIETPLVHPQPHNWRTLLPSSKNIELRRMDTFAQHLVLYEKYRGLIRLRILDRRTQSFHFINLPDAVYAVYVEENREYESEIFRFGYDSFNTPYTVYDYNMNTRRLTLRDRQVVEKYDSTAYESEYRLVESADGVKVPMSLVYRRDLRRSSGNPVVLYGYGAYGVSIQAGFSSLRLGLLDRGVIYAIAHVRGGGELGPSWHHQGRHHYKKNSIQDFIACAEYMVDAGYTTTQQLALMGESAGGFLVGASLNQKSEFCRAVVLLVPFLDAINTLIDPDIPEAIQEREEWGNPQSPADLKHLLSLSPYENVRSQKYPDALVISALNDSHVRYWEALKWITRLRDHATNHPQLLLHFRSGGHQQTSNSFEVIQEQAMIMAFLLDRLGTTEKQ